MPCPKNIIVRWIVALMFLIPFMCTGKLFAQNKADTTKQKTFDEPMETEAQFPGGSEAFQKFIYSNLHYVAGAEGKKVFITFVIGIDGTLSDFKVSRGVNEETNNEALRVIKKSPKWKPDMQNGNPVIKQYTMPVIFPAKNTFSERTLAQDEFFASPYGKNVVSATYPGGNQAFINFLAAHMKLPDSLRISDTLKTHADKMTDVNFEIEKNGTVSGVNLSNSINPGIDTELVNAIMLSVWIPAASDKQPIAGGHFMKIYFIKK